MIDLFRKRHPRPASFSRDEQRHALIPICSCCHKIQDGQKAWQRAQPQVADIPDTAFSHGLCPGCYEEQRAAFRKVRLSRTFGTVAVCENRV